jgi:hypothetical protein
MKREQEIVDSRPVPTNYSALTGNSEREWTHGLDRTIRVFLVAVLLVWSAGALVVRPPHLHAGEIPLKKTTATDDRATVLIQDGPIGRALVLMYDVPYGSSAKADVDEKWITFRYTVEERGFRVAVIKAYTSELDGSLSEFYVSVRRRRDDGSWFEFWHTPRVDSAP